VRRTGTDSGADDTIAGSDTGRNRRPCGNRSMGVVLIVVVLLDSDGVFACVTFPKLV
jgi:hypothetical protein